MKRIYLLGGALLLLIIIAVNYSQFNNPSNLLQTATAHTTGSDGTSVAAPVGVTFDAPATQVQSTMEMPATTSASRVRHGQRQAPHYYAHVRRVSHHENDIDYTQQYPEQPVVLRRYTPGEDIAAEKTGEYTAQKKSVVTVRKRSAKDNFARYYAHHKNRSGIGFGPEIGFNQNGLKGGTGSNRLTSSVNVGVIVNVPVSNNFSIQPALKYINKGAKSYSSMDVRTNEKLSMHYLQMPVDLVYKFGKPDNARIVIGGGPYVSYLLGTKHQFRFASDGFADVIGAGPNYDPGQLSSLDWGLGGFIGCETPEGFFARAGYEQGLKDIRNNSSAGEYGKNYSFMVSVGLIFGGLR